MDLASQYVSSVAFSSIVGIISPFILPIIYGLFKRELSKEEKRLLNTLLALTISVIIAGTFYEFKGNLLDSIGNFLTYLLLNYGTVKGMTQTVYEVLVKSVSRIDVGLSDITKELIER